MSLPSYPAYRDSGVAWLGKVPAHWSVSQSRRLFQERKDRASAGDRQLTASQKHGVIYQDQFMLLEGQKVVQVIHGADILKRAEPNDFVISMRSFQGGIEWCGFAGSISSAYVMLIPSGALIAGYYRHLFKSATYIQALQSTTNLVRDGQALRFTNFALVDLPVVPRAEQSAIAAFLDRETAKIDALVAEQEKLIALLKEKRQAVISHAVTKGLDPTVPMKDSGVEWLGDVPAHWDRAQLGRVCVQVSDGPHFSPTYVDDGVMFLSARNIAVESWSLDDAKYISDADYVEFSKRVVPEKGDVLYTKGGTTGIARVVDLDDRFQVWVHVAVLKLDRAVIDPYYLAYALNSIGCYEQSQLHTRGATNQDLGLTRMTKIWLALPAVQEQIAIKVFLDRRTAEIDELVQAARTAVALLQERRTALISAAVTGKIDLRGFQTMATA
jgi:type I restriction enzyme S subunit